MKRAIPAAALALVLGLLPHASFAADSAIVAGPGATFSTYATPVMAYLRGGTLTLVNLDIDGHDVVADDTRAPGTAPWCPAGGPRCPLFYAELIGLAQTAPVNGLDDLAPGVYMFHCSPHPWMKGRLAVL
ncbi:MAG: cupredoxin domain-containing protein [Actinomycetota bacterium]